MGRGALRMKYSRKEHFQEAVRIGVCAYTWDLYVGTRGWIKRGKVVKYGKRRLHVCKIYTLEWENRT